MEFCRYNERGCLNYAVSKANDENIRAGKRMWVQTELPNAVGTQGRAKLRNETSRGTGYLLGYREIGEGTGKIFGEIGGAYGIQD